MAELKRWERLELWLFDNGIREFRQADLVVRLGVTPYVASQMIQAYLDAQVNPRLKTLYVLHRTGRTRNAVWHVGHLVKDAKEISKQFGDDIGARAMEVIVPTLNEIAEKNPRARKHVTAKAVEIGRIIEQLAAM